MYFAGRVMRYRAFLAAIDDYGNPRNNLPSCVNDLKYVGQLLRSKLGVPDDKIRALTNGQVTVEAMQSGLEWLTGDTSEDERLLFFFSGHGFQLPATESGSVDEALVLSQDKFFRDDALVKSSKAARPGTLTVVLDCCFGGGGDKVFMPTGDFGSFITPKRWSPTREFLAKSPVFTNTEAALVTTYKPFGGRPISSKAPTSYVYSAAGATPWPTAVDEAGQALINGALLAACLEDETASASTDKTAGLSAFTYALKLLVDQQGLELTLRQAQEGTDRILKRMGFRQTSTLKIGTGPIDRDSRFLSLEHKALIPSSPTDRRIDMADDQKFLERLVPVLIERVVHELTKKGYSPGGGSDKFFPGAHLVVPVLVNRVIDELTKKGYSPANGAAEKHFAPDIGDMIDRAIRGMAGGKDFTPTNAGTEKFGLRDVAEIVVRELMNKGYVADSAGSDKFIPPWVAPIVVDQVVRHFAR